MNSIAADSVRGVPSVGRIRMIDTWIVVVVVISLAGNVATAQDSGTSLPPADTSSPRGTLNTFIDSCNEFYRLTEADRHFRSTFSPIIEPLVRRILDCLDTRELPDYARDDIASEAAVCLKEILDRVALPPIEEIPDIEAIEAGRGTREAFQVAYSRHPPHHRQSRGRAPEARVSLHTRNNRTCV